MKKRADTRLNECRVVILRILLTAERHMAEPRPKQNDRQYGGHEKETATGPPAHPHFWRRRAHGFRMAIKFVVRFFLGILICRDLHNRFTILGGDSIGFDFVGYASLHNNNGVFFSRSRFTSRAVSVTETGTTENPVLCRNDELGHIFTESRFVVQYIELVDPARPNSE